MTQNSPFNPLTVPVDGTSLIEASAGTGKTYGIAALFTRLVVLEQMPVESVLVVTFTKAATAELKTRLRARLDSVLEVLEAVADAAENPQALKACCEQTHPGDGILFPLLEQALAQESRSRLIVRLKAAVGGFDNAAVYTIHGFCQRLLRDYAFFCGAPFDVELAEEEGGRLLAPVQDFWREHISPNPLRAGLVFKHRQTPQTVLEKIKSFVGRPYLAFEQPPHRLEQAQAEAETAWREIAAALPQLAPTFWRVYPQLKGNIYNKNTFEKLFAGLQSAAAAGCMPEYHEKLAMLDAAVLAANTKKAAGGDHAAYAELHALAVLGQRLAALAESEQNALAALQLQVLRHLDTALAEQKKSRRERSFDDLLLDVYQALTEGPLREQLAQAVSSVWRAALIDEFQDTDPLQYEIFRRLFIGRNRPLFLVGDPKQAIYSFRGADIYAYLQAAADAAHRYTLTVNHRSHARLVDGVGALFGRKRHPFVLSNIRYPEVRAARAHSRLQPAGAAIQVRWLHKQEETEANKDVLRSRAAEYCADEIAAALNEAAAGRLNYRQNAAAPAEALQAGQIAVLVRTYNEGGMVAAALKKRGVQSVLLSRESVFASAEAEAVAALLGFWLQPQQAGSLSFVLGGVLFGYKAAELYALSRDEAALSGWVESARSAADTWQQRGIYAAMQQFAARHGIETRLLAQGSERSLTNYHQIIERLAEEGGGNLAPSALHQWLLEQIRLAKSKHGGAGENNLLRLESDENLVKIVTMHAAKGLQYPLVYCPFAWDAKSSNADDWQILHRNGRSELLSKHQLNDDGRALLAAETAAENLRLLYVALTRAEERLVLYAAYCGDTPDNAFAYLLEGGKDAGFAQTREAYAEAKKNGKTEGAMAMLKRNWQHFVQNAPENTEFEFTEFAPPPAHYRPPHVSDGLYRAAVVPERTFDLTRHTSFTGLSRQTRSAEEGYGELQPAVDAAETGLETAPENGAHAAEEGPSESGGNSIHEFPRGADAGVCLHEILEQFDFSQPAAAQTPQTAAVLERYGFSDRWLEAVSAMLENVRRAPLGGAMTLAEIPPPQRVAEMAFTLYMEDFRLDTLRAGLRQNGGLPAVCADAAQWLDFADLKGFLNGFIDMVCLDADGTVTVIDYKSNRLGRSGADYTQQAMDEAVAHHHYYLQALIYAIAVARHFKARGRPLQTVAVRYFFLRGLDGVSANGVWAWDIDAADLATWV